MAETNLPAINKGKRPSTEVALRQREPTPDLIRSQGHDEFGTVVLPTNHQPQSSIRILRLPDVMKRVGLCRASIYAHMTSGTFPRSISLGARAVGWLEHEVDAWLAAKIQARGKEAIPLTTH